MCKYTFNVCVYVGIDDTITLWKIYVDLWTHILSLNDVVEVYATALNQTVKLLSNHVTRGMNYSETF